MIGNTILPMFFIFFTQVLLLKTNEYKARKKFKNLQLVGLIKKKMVTILREGGNLAASKIRNLECPNYEICLIDYGCGKFNRKIHIMEQYP